MLQRMEIQSGVMSLHSLSLVVSVSKAVEPAGDTSIQLHYMRAKDPAEAHKWVDEIKGASYKIRKQHQHNLE